MPTFLYLIAGSIFVSAISFVGAFSVLSRTFFQKTYAAVLVSFAAGVMLAAALLDLLPEALEESADPAIFTVVLAAIVFFFFLERFVLWFHHHHGGHGMKPSSVLVLVGDGIHNIIDGVTLAAAFLASPALGLTTMFAIAAHEIPQEVADFSVLTANGMSRRKALFWNFMSGLTSMAGAIGGYFFLSAFEQWHWALLSFAAGMFLYIACSDLIPELHEDAKVRQRWQQAVPFLLGIFVLFLVTRFAEGAH